jgi:hypothetical protein
MDTISRENNSMLPVGGIIVGVIALLLGGYAAITLSKVNKTLAEQDARLAKIDAVESTANNAMAAADGVKKDLAARMREVQGGFDQMGPAIGNLQATVSKLEESLKKPVPADKGGKKGGEAAVAAPGEYIVKAGDTGMKIATAHKVSVSDLVAVNPGVNWNNVKPGQKIKLPAKK